MSPIQSPSNCVEKVNTRIRVTKCRISLMSSRISIAKCRISSTRCRIPTARCRIDFKKEASGYSPEADLNLRKTPQKTCHLQQQMSPIQSPSNCEENVNTRIRVTKCRIRLMSSRISIAKCRISSTRYRIPQARCSIDFKKEASGYSPEAI